MKRTALIIVIAVFIASVHGQKLKIGDVYARAGDTVNVPVIARDFKAIAAIGLSINFDRYVLNYVKTKTRNSSIESMISHVNNDNYRAVWMTPDLKTLLEADSAVLFEIVFVFKGGVTELSFDTVNCPVGDLSNKAVKVKFANGVIYDIATGLIREEESAVKVFPVPMKDLLLVRAFAGEVINRLILTDMKGIAVREGFYGGLNMAELEVSDLPAGVYVLQTEFSGRILRRKIIKE